MLPIKNSIAFVTGANRGLGLAFAKELLRRGASKVYAGVRNPETVDIPGVVAIRLDVTDPASAAAAAKPSRRRHPAGQQRRHRPTGPRPPSTPPMPTSPAASSTPIISASSTSPRPSPPCSPPTVAAPSSTSCPTPAG